MFFDSRRGADIPKEQYDVVIIGGGPAGITLAVELMGQGLRIALLESGGEDFEDDIQDLNEGRIEGNDDEFDLYGSRLRYLGGTTNHWGGHCTPLDPIDFSRAPATGETGWPLSLTDLEPLYRRAHDYCDLGAYQYDVSALTPAGEDLLLLPDSESMTTSVLRQSEPTRFGTKYRDTLEASDDVEVWLYATATGLTTAADQPQSVTVQNLEGRELTFNARAVVLAPGSIEATRLLLWANAQNGTDVGNAGGLLGKCYMDHPSGGAASISFDRPVSEKVYWSELEKYADNGVPIHFVWHLAAAELEARNLPNAHYYVIPVAEDKELRDRRRTADRSFGALKRLGKWMLGRDVGAPFSASTEYCAFVEGADELVADRTASFLSGEGTTRALLKYETEQRPDRSNTVTLDAEAKDALGIPRSVLRWAPSADDMEAVRETARIVGGLIGAAGLGRLQLEDHDEDPYWNSTTAWHQLGTMRMAESPTAGVVDLDCRVHGAGDLYVASGAVFPTVGRANPTLTVVALTIRLADHLKGKFAA